jgi:hypothetical protein
MKMATRGGSPLQEKKMIETQIYDSRGKLQMKKNSAVVSGASNLISMDALSNNGAVKRLLN